jgi:hypothetical protein
VFPVTLAQSSVHFYLSTFLHLLHQKKLFERKFVLLFTIFLFLNGSAAILPSSESSNDTHSVIAITLLTLFFFFDKLVSRLFAATCFTNIFFLFQIFGECMGSVRTLLS